MRTRHLAGCVVAVALLVTSAQADPLPLARLTPDELTWRVDARGVRSSNLVGDPRRAGLYVYHARFPSGFRNPPHVHRDERVVTVLSGTLLVGYGERFDEGAMKALPPGSVFTEPAGQSHYAWARDGDVVLQVVGYGPSDTTWSPK